MFPAAALSEQAGGMRGRAATNKAAISDSEIDSDSNNHGTLM